jgi:hypothetical protein
MDSVGAGAHLCAQREEQGARRCDFLEAGHLDLLEAVLEE